MPPKTAITVSEGNISAFYYETDIQYPLGKSLRKNLDLLDSLTVIYWYVRVKSYSYEMVCNTHCHCTVHSIWMKIIIAKCHIWWERVTHSIPASQDTRYSTFGYFIGLGNFCNLWGVGGRQNITAQWKKSKSRISVAIWINLWASYHIHCIYCM